MTTLRQQLIDTARGMSVAGLNAGTAGNASVRAREGGIDGFLITPTGMAYDALDVTDMVFLPLSPAPDQVPGETAKTDREARVFNTRKPSSEWRFHHDIYAARADAQAIVHAHPPFATSLACLRREIPAFHYMIARFGGDSLRCADYATFGTQALSDAALAAMRERNACLLANHGMLVFGADLEQALARGIELETLCEQYWRACQLGEPIILGAEEMQTILRKFATYGQQDAPQ